MLIRILAALFIVAVVVPSAFGKRKDDVVVMKNGDRMTGEIKKLDGGKLSFKSDYMAETVQLDWNEVERLESKDQFHVSLTTGQILEGRIEKKPSVQREDLDFSIGDEGSQTQASRNSVVVINPVEDKFWNQLTGSIDYGFSFTGGQNVIQSSLSADVNYRAEKWSLQSAGSSVFNGQRGSSNSGRNTVNMLYTRQLTTKWFAGALGDLLNSQQQDLKLRTTVGGGLGRFLARTDHTSFSLLSGASFSRERYTAESGNNPQSNNGEALFQMRYSMYRFSNTQVDLTAYVYPNLTTPGRVRSGLETGLKFELFRNFFWKFSLYENFDSQPPVYAPRNDFGTSTSVGWKF